MSSRESSTRLAFLTSVIFALIVIAVIVIAVLVTLPRPVTGEATVQIVEGVDGHDTASAPHVPQTPEKSIACDYAGFIGQQADQIGGAALKGHPVRIVRKGMMVTMEYLQGRINLHVDDHGMITAVTCG